MIEIKDIQGNVRLHTAVNRGSRRRFLLMKEDYITLKFSLKEPVHFKLGDYAEDPRFGRFELCDLQQPAYNASTGGYDYDLRLDACYRKWKNKIFKYTPETGGREASWNLTATLDDQLGVFLRNLKALGYAYEGKDFDFSIDGSVENKARLMSYDSTNLIDALSRMAETWECEWWMEKNHIRFGRCEQGDAVNLEIGVNVEEMTRSDARTNYATRVYAFGSTRNLPADYRPADESMLVNGVVQRRLMLPVGTPYIDAYPGLETEEAVEQVVVFDEVYPRRTGVITAAEAYEHGTDNEDGTQTCEKIYRFTDTGINFSSGYMLEGEELHIVFRSGSMNGMDFAVLFNPLEKSEKKDDGTWNADAQLWQIKPNENYGRKLPDEKLKPEAGDTYVLYGWDSTKIAGLGLLAAAEQELKAEAERYVEKSKVDPSTYTVKMMCAADDVLPQAGARVKLVNEAFFDTGSRESRIIGFEYNLDKPYDHPVYTVGETAAYSRLGELESKVESITLNGNLYSPSSLDSIARRLYGMGGTSQETTENIQVTAPGVGYYQKGDVILKGTGWEKIIKNMLYKVQGAELKGKLSTANDVEYGSAKGKITYEAAKNGNGDIVEAYYDNNKANRLAFGAEMNGIRTAVRQLEGVYTTNETYQAAVSFAARGDLKAVTLTDKISVNVRRRWFAGVCASVPATSAQVRALGASGLYMGKGEYKFNVGAWKMLAICIPEGEITDLTVTAYPGNFIEDTGVCSGPSAISVQGADGSAAVNYKMWVIKAETLNDADTFTFKTS